MQLTSESPASRERNLSRSSTLLVLLVALVSRSAAMLLLPSVFEKDIDKYRQLAHNLVEHGTYGVGDSPTAYRPVLYPLVLAPFAMLGPLAEKVGVAGLHLLLGVATVALTIRVGKALGLARWSLLAGLLVAVDPLLLFWGTQLMTETLHAFLLILLIAALVEYWKCGVRSAENGVVHSASVPSARWRSPLGLAMRAGVIAGLTALCRPETWLFVSLVFAVLVVRAVTPPGRAGGQSDRGGFSAALFNRGLAAFAMLLTAGAVCLPWTLRNWWVLGVPVLTTTHGGYTLLLANNSVFYREVVNGPSGAIWKKSSSDRWHEALEHRLTGLTETQRDRACYGEAQANIRSQPLDFLRSIARRVVRLWRLVPHDIQGQAWRTRMARYAIGTFYALELILLLGALASAVTWRTPCLLLIVLLFSTTLVHAFYWSNMRMRAGVIPAVGLLAASVFSQGKRKS